MGNSSSSSGRNHQDEAVDFGSLSPQWFTGPRDWNQAIVSQLICQRRLAPFYRPLEEYDDSWDDDQILAARKDPVDASGESVNAESTTRIEATASAPKPSHSKRPGSMKEPMKPEAAIYRGAVECPICFLYYPPNINHSRCCDQAICTECFVQIKRNEPTTTHLVSEPAACPYCVQENFGVVYTPPPWRTGIGSEGAPFPWSDSKNSPGDSKAPTLTHKRRQKSFSHDSPEVVTIDQIRPDWEAKLAAVRAAVARRANRRIIMRQVGDRLIPVGVTSGRVHPINGEDGQSEADGGGSRRSRRHRQQPQQGFDQLFGQMGIAGQDLEELMIMEAMRLSLIEHEEQQRKEAEEKKKKEAEEAARNQDTSVSSAGLSDPSAQGQSLSTNASPSTSQPTFNLNATPSQISRPPSRSANADSSRTRTPSPSASRSNLASSGDSSWQRPNPPPFSTLNAALSAASTASAILRAADSQAPSPATNNGVASLSPNGQAEDTTIPVVQIDDDATPAQNGGSTPLPGEDSPSALLEPRTAYEPLPSSPESTVGNEPLLGQARPQDAVSTKQLSASGDSPHPESGK